MICDSCGHSWTVLLAHIIRKAHVDHDGVQRELISCPRCGRVQSVIVEEPKNAEEPHTVEK